MPSRAQRFPAPGIFLLTAVLALLNACAFIPTHEVAVDAISGPNPSSGHAYRLADKDPLVVREARQHRLVLACVAAALEAKGLYEAPAGVKPDITIEVDYGTSRGVSSPTRRNPGMPATTESFLSLSARLPKTDNGPGKGEEIWNVRTSIVEDGVDLGTLIPVLAAVSADYIGQDTQMERSMKISEKQPQVANVKSVAQAVSSGRILP
jgi:hypothetical protein